MKKITCLLALLCCYFTYAQNFKFGEVSKDELKEVFNPQDSSASATYLYKYRNTYFVYNQDGFELETEIHERIKIYNQDGFDYATKKINLYKASSDKENLVRLKAITYNLIDDKIEENKLKKNGVFKSELSKYYNQHKFTMPNIKAGCIIEYKYVIKSPFYQNVDVFKFQHDIPINKLEARFEAPEYFNYKSKSTGYVSLVPEKTNTADKVTIKSKSRTGGDVNSTVRTTFHSSDIAFQKSIDKYSLSNIPALKDEPYVNSINNYRASVKYELSFTKFPNSTVNYYSTTWPDVIKTIYKSPNFGAELEKTSYFKSDIDALLASATTTEAKAGLIFNYVKSKVKWNGYYGKYTRDGVKKAYKQRTGNVAEINLMLTAMLRYAGLNANPVLVSTRNNGVPMFPTREGYNYVISAIELENNVILLDATSKFSSPNVLPYRTLNWQGRIVRKRGSTALINLYPNKNAASTNTMMVNIDADGSINGQIRTALTNHKALKFRTSYVQKDKEQYLQNLENKYNGIEISDFKVKNELDLSKAIVTSYKFLAEDQCDVIGNKMYVSPLFFFTTAENPFKLKTREFPVDFGYPTITKYSVNISIPNGYVVESLPKPIAIALADGLGTFSYKAIAANNTIQVTVKYTINNSTIPAQYYQGLKAYFNTIVEKENETIILSKS